MNSIPTLFSTTSAKMWAPVDITTVPTAKELVEAKLAIEQVESKLKDALLSLEQAQLRAVNIEKNLNERRAWIAPIRRLSSDVLSLIFEFCGEDNWRTPLRISGVSGQWRYLVLATPRAWAFLHVHEIDGEEDLIRHFFEHSGQRPLHVFLSETQQLTILSEVIKRLECLSVDEFPELEEPVVFPKLKRFSLRSEFGRIGLSDLCIARFPALREFICESIIKLYLPSSVKVIFPPLQVLSVLIEESNAWRDLLMGCRSSLVSLRLHAVGEYPTSKPEVLLPVLRYLEICVWDHYPEIWPLDMKTPALETYIEATHWDTKSSGTTPFHGNIGNVTRIRISYAPNLSAMSFLRTLQLQSGAEIGDVLSQLQGDRSLCPRLERIEVMRAGDLARYEIGLAEVNRERSKPISIRTVETWATALPYEIFRSSVSNRFGTDIPADISHSAGQTCHAVDETIGSREATNSRSTTRDTSTTLSNRKRE